MTEASGVFPKAFAVWFRDIERWDPASFHRISWHWPKHLMVPIGNVLRVRKERVDKSALKFNELQPITIHFDGSIDRRTVAANREYSMDLWFARPGDIVVAKIDLKNGAVGIVPSNWTNVVVTSHFAVYEPDSSRLLSEYLQRLIQTKVFKAHLWRNKVGAEGRKEVKLDFFEREKIPLPPLAQQKAIVDHWRKAHEEVAAARQRVEQYNATINTRFFAALGLTIREQAESPKAFAVLWKDFFRWGVNFNRLNQSVADFLHGKYHVVQLDSVIEFIQYGTSEKANTGSHGVPVIRMNNIVNGELDLSNLKHIQLSGQETEKLLLKEGDILFNRTNSKELVGKCAVFHAEGNYVFASYLIRIRIDQQKADPDFICYVINSLIGRRQIDALSRQIIGQANINSKELRDLRIPLPPLLVQHKIMQQVAARRSEIARERERAKQIETDIDAYLDALILGIEHL